MSFKHRIIQAGFAAVRASGLARAAASRTRGVGAILMFHHVRPWTPRAYAPNRELEIAPEFFDDVLQLLKRLGWIVVTMDEAIERIAAGKSDRPFAALTFDDGYRDNREWALPILAREKMPMTFYATTGFVDRTARLWWVEVEEAVRRAKAIDLTIGGQRLAMACANDNEKERAASALLAALRASPQDEVDRVAAELSRAYGVDGKALVEELCLDAEGVAAMAGHPLVTLGAHTLTHPMLAKVPPDRARRELVDARADLERRFGKQVRHVAYPVGDPGSAGAREFSLAREAGYASAVTTRPGMLFPEHASHLMALPRLSINGRHQSLKNIELLLTGFPFALWNKGRRVNAD